MRPREQAREQIKPVVCTPAIDLLSSICNVGVRVKESMDLDFYQLNRRGDGQSYYSCTDVRKMKTPIAPCF